MNTVAKMTCTSVTTDEETKQSHWSFSAVYHNDDPDHENSQFAQATPSANYTMTVDTDVYKGVYPEQGKEYYFNITLAEAK